MHRVLSPLALSLRIELTSPMDHKCVYKNCITSVQRPVKLSLHTLNSQYKMSGQVHFMHAPHFTEIATLPQSLPILLNQYNLTYKPKYLI